MDTNCQNIAPPPPLLPQHPSLLRATFPTLLHLPTVSTMNSWRTGPGRWMALRETLRRTLGTAVKCTTVPTTVKQGTGACHDRRARATQRDSHWLQTLGKTWRMETTPTWACMWTWWPAPLVLFTSGFNMWSHLDLWLLILTANDLILLCICHHND